MMGATFEARLARWATRAFVAGCLAMSACHDEATLDDGAPPDADERDDLDGDLPPLGEASAPEPGDATPEPFDPPDAACLDAAADADLCPLPASYCLDAIWLEYFDDGRCSDAGRCVFTPRVHDCSTVPAGQCVDGGCVTQHLTAPSM